MHPPEAHEYNPNFSKYIKLALATGNHFEDMLAKNTAVTLTFFRDIPVEKHGYHYAPGKWSVKEVLMHIIDTERVFAYRALVCGRGDAATPLYMMDENLYAANCSVDHRSMKSLLEEFLAVRSNSAFVFKHLTEEQSRFLGNNLAYNISARALAFTTIGHILHHIKVLQERYLN